MNIFESLRSRVREIERHVRLKHFLGGFLVDDLLFVKHSSILPSLPVRCVLVEYDLFSSLGRLERAQCCVLTAFAQPVDLLPVVSKDTFAQWFGQVLTDSCLDVLHWVDLLEETLVRHVALVVVHVCIGKLKRPPEYIQRDDIFLGLLLLLPLLDEGFSIEQEVWRVVVECHQFSEDQKQLGLFG